MFVTFLCPTMNGCVTRQTIMHSIMSPFDHTVRTTWLNIIAIYIEWSHQRWLLLSTYQEVTCKHSLWLYKCIIRSCQKLWLWLCLPRSCLSCQRFRLLRYLQIMVMIHTLWLYIYGHVYMWWLYVIVTTNSMSNFDTLRM